MAATPKRIDRAALRLAARQHGAFAHDQISAAATDDQIHYRVRRGMWDAPARSVYTIPGFPETFQQRVMVAVLAAGPEAVASHDTAAYLLGLRGFRAGAIHVTRPRCQHRGLRIATVHETKFLRREFVTKRDGIPVTTGALTFIDVASGIPEALRGRVFDDMLIAGTVTLVAAARALSAVSGRGKPGVRAARHVLAPRLSLDCPPANDLEEIVLDIIRAAGIRTPDREVTVRDADGRIGRVDLFFDTEGVVIECDGRAFHVQMTDWEKDREKDLRFAGLDYRTVRVTWKLALHRRELVTRAISRALGPARQAPPRSA